MWLTIIDYRTAEVTAQEVKEDVNVDWDEYVRDMVGHIDHYYMSAPSLVIKISELDNPNQQIITKLKQ
jgi:hypothetical protein